MSKKLKIKLISIIAILLISISTYSIADVGSFDRYDSGSSDWGSSSWDSDWESDWDSDWGSSSWDSDYSSSSGELFLLGSLIGNVGPGTAIFIIIIYIIIKAVGRSKNRDRARYNEARTRILTHRPQVSREPVVNISQSRIYAKRIQEFDPLFSEEKILSWSKNLFVKLQNAWTARDWEPMRPFETEELFEQHKNQVQGYINTNKINIMDRIAVNYACLYGFRKEGDKDILEIALKSTMKDYIIDETTRNVLEGNPNVDRTTVYKLTFERKSGVLTKEGEIEINTTNCPNCGAPTQVTSSGKCDYCGSIITTRDYGWVLAGLEPLRN